MDVATGKNVILDLVVRSLEYSLISLKHKTASHNKDYLAKMSTAWRLRNAVLILDPSLIYLVLS